jgi:hypothetical protein
MSQIHLPSGKSPSLTRRWIIVALSSALALVFLLSYHFSAPPNPPSITPSRLPQSQPGIETCSNKAVAFNPQKPKDVKIVGLVFFGRKSRVEILRCYLERNMVDNGGWLDEIVWIKNTDKKDDLVYLDEILASSPRYSSLSLDGIGLVGYGLAWKTIKRGTMYVKIDDDVVYLADDTIPRIVTMKLAHPEYVLVSANMINSPLLGWVHYHMGAIHPYLPEFTEPGYIPPPSLLPTPKPWTYTSYPNWTGPEDYYFGTFQEPPYDGHRWLRLPHDSDITRTPIIDAEYATWGNSLKSWPIAAQQHYSFLENLANSDLHLYKTSSPHHESFGATWFTTGKRLSINLIAIWSDDVLDNLPMTTVDEEWLTVVLPKDLNRQVAVNMEALAAHFTFGDQWKLQSTDLLPRYKDYAMQHVCAR